MKLSYAILSLIEILNRESEETGKFLCTIKMLDGDSNDVWFELGLIRLGCLYCVGLRPRPDCPFFAKYNYKHFIFQHFANFWFNILKDNSSIVISRTKLGIRFYHLLVATFSTSCFSEILNQIFNCAPRRCYIFYR